MSFMLGSFTQGMFSGMDAVTRAFHNVESYKQMKQQTERGQMDLDAAKAAKDALDKNTGTASASATQAGGQTPSQTTPDRSDTAENPTTPTAPRTPVKKIDLNSVEQPNYLSGVTTRHNELEHQDPGTEGVTSTPAAPQAVPTQPAPAAPATPQVPAIATIGAPEHAGNAVGIGGKPNQESAIDTFNRLRGEASDWLKGHSVKQGAVDVGTADVPGYIAGNKPAGAAAPNPTAAAQTGWGAAFRPVPNGQVQPQSPQPAGPSLAQQAPLGQQIMSALPGIN